MFIGSGRRKNSRRKSYGVCDDDFCIYGNSGNNCIGDCWFYHILVYLIQRQGCEKDENR